MSICKQSKMDERLHILWQRKFIQLVLVIKIVTHVSCTGLINNDLDRKSPITYKEMVGTNYRIYRKRVDWEKAFIFCSKCVGNFATFDTPDSANKVRDLIYNISHFSEEFDYGERREEFGLNGRYWIGLHDQKLKEGVWKWVKNTRVKPQVVENVEAYPWYTNQPDHHDKDAKYKGEHCVGFWNPVYHLDSKPDHLEKHTLNDMNCDQQLYFICEATDKSPYSGSEPLFCKTPSAVDQ